MSRRNSHTLLLVSSIVLLMFGCAQKDHLVLDAQERNDLTSLNARISMHPSDVAKEIDRRITVPMDSASYYRLVVLKAKALFFLTEYDSVKILLEDALSFCEHNKDSKPCYGLLSSANNMMGNYYSRLTMMDSANFYFHRAFNAAEKSHYHDVLPDIAINVADTYVRKGKFDLGAFWYWKSLSLDDSLKVPEPDRFPSYFGLAQVHMELQDFSACDSFYAKAGKYYDSMKPYEKHTYLNNRGNSYYFRQDYQTALSYFRKSKQLVEQWPHMEYERHLTNVNLGEVFLFLNQVDSASYYLSESYDFFKEMNNISALYYIDTQLIELALKQKNMSLAKQRIEASVDTNYVEPAMLLMRNRYLQHYFEENGDFKKAYYYQRENKRLDDSIRNERVRMRSSEIALKYQLDNQLMQKEILIKQQENEMLRLNQYLFYLLLTTVALSAIIWIFYLYKSGQEAKKVWELQTAINSLRLDNVRNRISPHFIFNVLSHEMSNLQNETDKSNLTTLIHLLRRQLELADQISITLSDELDFVKCVLSLEQKSLGKDFDFLLDVDPSIDLNNVFIPSMSIYILVENSVKHTLTTKNGKRKLWVRITSVDDRIAIRLSDNGGGFRTGTSATGTGTGFKIITRTIQLYNQYNENPIYMNIRNVDVGNAEIGCEVSYSIPKDYKFIIKS